MPDVDLDALRQPVIANLGNQIFFAPMVERPLDSFSPAIPRRVALGKVQADDTPERRVRINAQRSRGAIPRGLEGRAFDWQAQLIELGEPKSTRSQHVM